MSVALVNTIVRLADSLGWEVPSEQAFAERAGLMLDGGYALLDQPRHSLSAG